MEIFCDISFFTIDDWEFRIWRETKVWLRKSYMFKVVVHVCPTWFFVSTDNKAYFFRSWKSKLFNDFQTIVTCCSWSLVIRSTTRVETAIFDSWSVRISVPTATSWHYIHVGKDSKNFFSFTKLKMSCIVVDIFCWVTITVCDFKEFLQSFYWTRSKWVLRICLTVITFWVDF